MLENYPNLSGYYLNSEDIYLPYSELNQFDFEKLMEFGFILTIKNGRVYLNGNEDSIAALIYDDISSEPVIQDVLQYRFDNNTSNILDEIKVYINNDIIFGKIKEQLLDDWSELTTEERKAKSIDWLDNSKF